MHSVRGREKTYCSCPPSPNKTTIPGQVLAVVIVNTLLTGIMAKLAKFERHVSLSDYTSTVTGKLALAQFLNTALIVILVNAGYTGGGLGILQVCRGIRQTRGALSELLW